MLDVGLRRLTRANRSKGLGGAGEGGTDLIFESSSNKFWGRVVWSDRFENGMGPFK